MPHLTIKNIKKEEFINKVEKLSKELTETIGCPEDWITISLIENNVTYVAGKDETFNNIFVDVRWFPRPEEMKAKVAKIINDTFKFDGRDIIVIFEILVKESYFENGTLV